MTDATSDADPTADTGAKTEEQPQPFGVRIAGVHVGRDTGLGAAYERVVAFCAPDEHLAGLHV